MVPSRGRFPTESRGWSCQVSLERPLRILRLEFWSRQSGISIFIHTGLLGRYYRGFPRGLPPVAADGGTKGVPARIRPQIGTVDRAPPFTGLIGRWETLPNGRFTRRGSTLARAAHTCRVGRPGCYWIGPRHGGKGARRSPSMRRRISANRVIGIPERLMSALGPGCVKTRVGRASAQQ